MKEVSRGAEAVIYLENDKVVKHRISKAYRHPELDKKIIKQRTKAEEKILKKAKEFIPVPEIYENEEKDKISMENIKGKKLADSLDFFPSEAQEKIMFELGKIIAKMHKEGIIHGDLTTSNMILRDNQLRIIDFGLGYFNGKYEDKAVDLHLLKQALEAKHFKNWKILFNEFEIGYRAIEPKEAEKIFEKLKAVEKRGRCKN